MADEIFKITKDFDRAKSLFEIAIDRLDLINVLPKNKTYKIIEEYYEVIKEILTSLMYFKGYKTLSHIKLIEFFQKNYSVLNDFQIRLIDSLRKLRNGTLYYGEKVNEIFLVNNEKEINKITSKLIKFMGKKLK